MTSSAGRRVMWLVVLYRREVALYSLHLHAVQRSGQVISPPVYIDSRQKTTSDVVGPPVAVPSADSHERNPMQPEWRFVYVFDTPSLRAADLSTIGASTINGLSLPEVQNSSSIDAAIPKPIPWNCQTECMVNAKWQVLHPGLKHCQTPSLTRYTPPLMPLTHRALAHLWVRHPFESAAQSDSRHVFCLCEVPIQHGLICRIC